ncbi:hypothetical protein Pan216_30600 [Planctomycetes bacterium Pan216]|uniref:DUF997 domain-containing protein n=1 Tax=Kolteria novifilia TaxID=2527975 RepID=A0A518B5D3_9BACT|nr:hypothetical protein Pan216_30600 [Planctomycetes bacterium Pan216]
MSELAATSSEYHSSRREAIVALVVWGVCLIWCVGVCVTLGYHRPAEEISLVIGIPAWVFWGVLMPWIAATLFSIGFGLFGMCDVDDAPEPDASSPTDRHDHP